MATLLLAGLGLAVPSALAQYPDDPVLYLPFSESSGSQATDASGNGHVTTLNNGGTWVAGQQGGGLELDGVDDYAVTQSASDLQITGDLTFRLWIKPHAYPTRWTGILSKRESDIETELNFRIRNSTTAQFYYGNGSVACVLNWNPSLHLPLSTWTQITGVRDLGAGTLTLYFNGHAGASRSTCGAAVPTWYSLLIGKQGSLAGTFDGVLDEIEIYDRAMTSAEIAWRYTRDTGVTNLLTNAGFELGVSNPPFASVGRGTLEIDDTLSAEGEFSLKHTATGNNSYTLPYTGQDAVVTPATEGQTFQFAAMASAASNTQIQMRLLCLDSAYNILNIGNKTSTATPTWQRFAHSHTCPAGTEYLSIRLDNDGGAGAIVWWDDLYLVHAINDADFALQNVPDTLTTGETTSVTVRMRNTGTTLWTRGQDYRLGSQNPQGNTTWGHHRVFLGTDDVVAPGETHDFTFDITAPSSEGRYDFQWRMVEELVQWFGASTPNLPIDVVAPPPPDITPPLPVSLTVQDRLWEIDGTKTYTMSLVASDVESGVERLETAINLQGDDTANPRGIFAWDADAAVYGGDVVACSGGGFASKDLDADNAETVTLVGCSTSLAGDERTVVLTVRPTLLFGALDDIDLSMSARDGALNVTPWSHFDLSFRSVVDAGQNTQGCGLGLTHSGGRYFNGPGATPTYMAGSHTWDNLQDRGDTPEPFDYAEYLQMMVAKNHNFMRMWSWQNANLEDENGMDYSMNINPLPWKKVEGCYDLYDGPLDLSDPSDFDPTKVLFDEDYFIRLARRIGDACGLGIYVDVMLFEGFSVKVCNNPSGCFYPWPHHPFNVANNCEGIDGNLGSNSSRDGRRFHEVDFDQPATAMEEIVGLFQKAYVDKVVNTLEGYDNVVYEIANEDVGSPANIDWEEDMIAYVRGQSGRPVGMTSFGFGNPNSVLRNSGANWISPAVNSGEDYAYDPPQGTGGQVIFSDNDHLRCILETPSFSTDCPNVGNQPGKWSTRANYRQWIWKSFTRGLNVMLMDAVENPPGANDPGAYQAVNPGNPAFPFARDYVGHTRYFSERIDLARAAPDPDACGTGYCLVEPGVQYLVYQPVQGSFTVNLQPGVYDVEWFNPHGIQTPSGKTEPIGPGIQASTTVGPPISVSVAGNRSFNKPFGCEDDGTVYECDSVLLLTVQPTEPPPAPPTNVAASDGSFTDRVRVTWTPVGNATHYEVWRGVVDDTTAATRVAAAVEAAFHDDTTAEPLPGGYFYWVKAVNAAGTSDFSLSDPGSLDTRPEIAVVRGWNGTEVTDGDTVALPPQIEGTPQIHRLTIENRGQGPLTIDNPATLLASHPCITQVAAVDGSVPAGAGTDLDIRVDCSEGQHQVALSIENDDPNEDPFDLTLTLVVTLEPTCVEDEDHLCLQNGRFRVSSTFVDPNTGQIRTSNATPYPESEESGFFWFFGPANLEIIVKILDGRTINGSFWVFHGAATGVEYTLLVEDIQTGATWTAVKPHNSFCGSFDIDAFPEGAGANVAGTNVAGTPDGIKVRGAVTGWIPLDLGLDPVATTGEQEAKSGSCMPSDTVLCLQDGRIAVEVDWVDHQGVSGQGHAIPRTLETGLFWYFGPQNLELMVKVLDGRTINDHWWVFYGSLSQVQFTLRVTDTVTGEVATYFNPTGQYCGDADVGALFAP